MSTSVIHTDNLVKTFSDGARDFNAVDRVNLTISDGEIVALLGHNGAGKSTLIDMILGLTTPTSGALAVFGRTPRQAIHDANVGAVLQSGGLLGNLTVRETIELIATTFPKPEPTETLLDRTHLRTIANRKVGQCSGGEQQRLRFALALLPDPDLLILDEPTAGMDTGARHEFWDTMQLQSEHGKTILFATHYLEEAQNFAHRIVMLSSGKVIADGPTNEVRALAGGHTVTVSLPSGFDATSVPGVQSVSHNGNRTVFHTHDSDALARYLFTSTPARHVAISQSTLEDVFLALNHTHGVMQ